MIQCCAEISIDFAFNKPKSTVCTKICNVDVSYNLILFADLDKVDLYAIYHYGCFQSDSMELLIVLSASENCEQLLYI